MSSVQNKRRSRPPTWSSCSEDEVSRKMVVLSLYINRPEPAIICTSCQYALSPSGKAVTKHLWETHQFAPNPEMPVIKQVIKLSREAPFKQTRQGWFLTKRIRQIVVIRASHRFVSVWLYTPYTGWVPRFDGHNMEGENNTYSANMSPPSSSLDHTSIHSIEEPHTVVTRTIVYCLSNTDQWLHRRPQTVRSEETDPLAQYAFPSSLY
jgi:hypothetical protein